MTRIALGPAALASAVLLTSITVAFVSVSVGFPSQAIGEKGAAHTSARQPGPDQQKEIRPQEIKDELYKILKRDHAFRDSRWSFVITVRDVVGDTLVDTTFRHRTKGDNREYDAVIQAKRAVLHVDLTGQAVYAILEEPEIQGFAPIDGKDLQILDQVLKIPVPPAKPLGANENPPAKAVSTEALMTNELHKGGKIVKQSGSVLAKEVCDRIYDLSYEFMDYPDDSHELAQAYYGPLIKAVKKG